MLTINNLFRRISAFTTTEISDSDLNDHYIPSAKEYYCRLCELTFSLTLTGGEYTSTDTTYPEREYMHNTIIAELASSRADAKMDNIHIDPVTGMMIDLHYDRAIDLMRNNYGVYNKKTGELVLPLHLKSSTVVLGGISDASY